MNKSMYIEIEGTVYRMEYKTNLSVPQNIDRSDYHIKYGQEIKKETNF